MLLGEGYFLRKTVFRGCAVWKKYYQCSNRQIHKSLTQNMGGCVFSLDEICYLPTCFTLRVIMTFKFNASSYSKIDKI